MSMISEKSRAALSITPLENLALSLVFQSIGEEQINRTMIEYREIAARLPKDIALHRQINDLLAKMAREGIAPTEFCSWKKRDRYWHNKPYPAQISLETMRRALVKSGMRELQSESRRTRPASVSATY
jgi:hypothetical protein